MVKDCDLDPKKMQKNCTSSSSSDDEEVVQFKYELSPNQQRKIIESNKEAELKYQREQVFLISQKIYHTLLQRLIIDYSISKCRVYFDEFCNQKYLNSYIQKLLDLGLNITYSNKLIEIYKPSTPVSKELAKIDFIALWFNKEAIYLCLLAEICAKIAESGYVTKISCTTFTLRNFNQKLQKSLCSFGFDVDREFLSEEGRYKIDLIVKLTTVLNSSIKWLIKDQVYQQIFQNVKRFSTEVEALRSYIFSTLEASLANNPNICKLVITLDVGFHSNTKLFVKKELIEGGAIVTYIKSDQEKLEIIKPHGVSYTNLPSCEFIYRFFKLWRCNDASYILAKDLTFNNLFGQKFNEILQKELYYDYDYLIPNSPQNIRNAIEFASKLGLGSRFNITNNTAIFKSYIKYRDNAIPFSSSFDVITKRSSLLYKAMNDIKDYISAQIQSYDDYNQNIDVVIIIDVDKLKDFICKSLDNDIKSKAGDSYIRCFLDRMLLHKIAYSTSCSSTQNIINLRCALKVIADFCNVSNITNTHSMYPFG